MIAAMMLPGAIPAVLRRTRASGHLLNGTVTAGVVMIAAGVYELTPIKRHCRLNAMRTHAPDLCSGSTALGRASG